MRSYVWASHTPDHLLAPSNSDMLVTPRKRRYYENCNTNSYAADRDQDFWGAYLGFFICFVFVFFLIFVLWYPMSYYYNDNDLNNNGIHDARERYYVHRHGIW